MGWGLTVVLLNFFVVFRFFSVVFYFAANFPQSKSLPLPLPLRLPAVLVKFCYFFFDQNQNQNRTTTKNILRSSTGKLQPFPGRHFFLHPELILHVCALSYGSKPTFSWRWQVANANSRGLDSAKQTRYAIFFFL